MKRQTERDYSATRMKRSRAYSPDRHFESGKYYSRRGQDTSPSRYDYFDKDTHSEKPGYKQRPFTTLCISGFSSRIPEHVIKEDLYNEFKCFGDLTIKFVTFKGEKMCYITFVHTHEAKSAWECKSGLSLPGHRLQVTPVFLDGGRHTSGDDSTRTKADSRGDGGKSTGRRPVHARIGTGDFGDADISPKKAPTPRPVSTLFVGNLEVHVSENELRTAFGKFGTIIDVDVKVKRGAGPVEVKFAFVKFDNPISATSALTAMDGRPIGKKKCTVGFGKVCPTRCLLVGGLSQAVRKERLEHVFARFGTVDGVRVSKSGEHAHVLFKTLEMAHVAYARADSSCFPEVRSSRVVIDFTEESLFRDDPPRGGRSVESRLGNRVDLARTTKLISTPTSLSALKSLAELPKVRAEAWRGFLSLKSYSFLTKLYFVTGEKSLAQHFLADKRAVGFSKRMLMDNTKLGAVQSHLLAAKGGWCFLAGFAASARPANLSASVDDVKRRDKPLRHLISYLQHKVSAGFCSFTMDEPDGTYICSVYAFPPCEFVYKLAIERCSGLCEDYKNDDIMGVLLVRSLADGQ